MLLGYVALISLTDWQYSRAPTGFIPEFDQGYLLTVVQLVPLPLAVRNFTPITCARVITCAPASIKSATERPSRAPSTTKSEMSATASGWFSLTPRSNRRRATVAF